LNKSQFNKLKPPKFEGETDPMVYKERLRRLENLFEIMECPERFKEHLATYNLKKKLSSKGGTVKPRVGEPLTPFQELLLLLTHFMPPSCLILVVLTLLLPLIFEETCY